MNNVIQNSKISETARLFQNIRIVNSIIESRCTLGDDCDIDGIIMHEKSELGRRNLLRDCTIGKGTYTGTNTIIKSTDIGKYCCISWNVSIGGSNHNYLHTSMYTDYWFKRTFGIENYNTDDHADRTFIGNDVWIAAGVNIISGVKIGDGCVIGAGSVITKDIEPYSVVVGVPGRVIKKRFDDETVEMLERIKWWDWSEERIIDNIDFLRNQPNKNFLRKLLSFTD